MRLPWPCPGFQVTFVFRARFTRGSSLVPLGRNHGQHTCHWTWQRPNLRKWDESKTPGFSTGQPWLAVNQTITINVQEALANPDSIFYNYQNLIQTVRRRWAGWFGADFELLDTADKVFAYIRKMATVVLVVANLSNEEQVFVVDGNVKSILIENTPAQEVFEKQIWAHGMLSVWNYL